MARRQASGAVRPAGRVPRARALCGASVTQRPVSSSSQALEEVHRLSKELGQPGSELPAAVVQHAPPQPSVQGTPLEVVLRAAGSPAAHQVAMWRQAGQGTGVRGARRGKQADPYVVRW